MTLNYLVILEIQQTMNELTHSKSIESLFVHCDTYMSVPVC
jgi:hypothetical protein